MPTADDNAEQPDMSAYLEEAAASIETLAALDMLEQSVVVLDRDWRYIFMNQSTLQLSNLTKAEVLGRLYWEVFPEIVGTRVDLAMRRAFGSPGKISIEYHHGLNGRWYNVDIISSGSYLMVYSWDVTEPRLAVLLNRRLMNSLDSLGDPILMIDRDVRYTFINKAAEGFVEKKRRELLGQNVWLLSPWLKDTPFGQACLRALKETEPFSIESYYEPRDRWLSVHYFPGPDGFTVHIADIHELKQAHERLQNLLGEQTDLERMHRAFDLMPHPLMMLDAELQFTYANAAAYEPNQRRPEQVIGMRAWEVNPGLKGSELLRRCRIALKTGERQSVELQLPPSGRWFRQELIPWHDQLILSGVDITKQKHSEESVGILTNTLEQAMGAGWDRSTGRDTGTRRPRKRKS